MINVDPNIISHLADRRVVTKETFLSLPDELRIRAFTIAKQTEADVLQQTLDALRQTTETGGTLWNFRENFPELVKPYTEAGRDWHLNLVVQQNVRQARAVGAYQARQRVKRAFPYVEYKAGINPRPPHAALNKKIFDVDDPFLASHTPPWDFGCNCDLIPRTAAQVGKVETEDQDAKPEDQRVVPKSPAIQRMIASNQLPDPVRGAVHPVNVATPSERGGEYSFRPDRMNQPVDLTGYAPEIRETLVKQLAQFGYGLSPDGSTAVPPGSPPPTPLTPSSSRYPRVGRPSVSKANAPSAALAAGSRFGWPVGRVSRPAPQIARVAVPLNRKIKEAA